MTKLFVTLALASSTLIGCTGDDPTADDFVGIWAYQDGQFEIDCGGQLMQFPLDSSLTETFSVGGGADLSKADNAGCAGITFEIDGGSAALAPVPQSCAIPNMGTTTATTYTFTLAADGESLISAMAGSFTPQGGSSACAFTGGGTLVRL